MPGDQNNDWRFQGFGNSSGAYNRTLAIDTPQSRAIFGAQTPKAAPPTTNGASRVIPSPSGTDWNSTFHGGSPLVPVGPDQRSGVQSATSRFDLNLSSSSDKSQLSLGSSATPAATPTDFYKDRVANMDLTKRDHELYGAGSDYGFTY